VFQSREPEYRGFGRAGQPSVFGRNWRMRVLFDFRAGRDDKSPRAGPLRTWRRVQVLDALIELVRRFGPGLRVVGALLMNVAAPH